MKRTWFIQPGPVGDAAEAEQHAEASTCPRCGRPTSSNLPGRPPMGFAVRVQRRCAECGVAIVFDYLPGRGYDGKLKGSFELPASPWPSLVLTPQVLAGRLERRLAALEELEARVAKDEAEADKHRQFGMHAAADALEALWELEKLPSAPESFRPRASRELEQRLSRAYVEKGGRVPPALAKRFEEAQAGTRASPPRTPEGWMLLWFQDPAAFEAQAGQARTVVGSVLYWFKRRYEDRVEAAGAMPRIDTPPPGPVALAYAIELVALLNGLLRDIEAGADAEKALERYEVASLDRLARYFELLERYQSALDRAARIVEQLERDGTADLVAESAWAGPLDLLQQAAAEACAWPLDGQSLTRTIEWELALTGLQKVVDAAAAANESDPRRAMAAALKAVP